LKVAEEYPPRPIAAETENAGFAVLMATRDGGGGDGGGGENDATHVVSAPAAVVLPRTQAAVRVWLLKHEEQSTQLVLTPPPAVRLPGTHAAVVQLPAAQTVHVAKAVLAVALQAAVA
jgi:hypothetical protein